MGLHDEAKLDAKFTEFAKQMTGLLILLLGGLSVMEGQMTVGMLVAFYSMMINFLRPLQEIFNFCLPCTNY